MQVSQLINFCEKSKELWRGTQNGITCEHGRLEDNLALIKFQHILFGEFLIKCNPSFEE